MQPFELLYYWKCLKQGTHIVSLSVCFSAYVQTLVVFPHFTSILFKQVGIIFTHFLFLPDLYSTQVYQFTNELELLVYLLIIQTNMMVSVYMQDKVPWK